MYHPDHVEVLGGAIDAGGWWGWAVEQVDSVPEELVARCANALSDASTGVVRAALTMADCRTLAAAVLRESMI